MPNSHTEHSLNALKQHQRHTAGRALGSLIIDSAHRVLDAALLLDIKTSVFEQLRTSINEKFYVNPLMPLYELICERYNNEIYNHQLELWADAASAPIERWSRFYFHELKPQLVKCDESVKAILGVMQFYPCSSQQEALDALLYKAKNLYFTGQEPAWVSDERIELCYIPETY